MKDHHLLAAVVADLLCGSGQREAFSAGVPATAALTSETVGRTVMLENARPARATHASGGRLQMLN